MKQVVYTPKVSKPVAPYSQAVKVGNMLYTSGQIPSLADGTIIDGDITAQTIQVLENVKSVVEAGGSDMSKVVKVTVFLQDIGDFSTVNEIYGRYFGEGVHPARSCVEVAKLPLGISIEIEVIAEI